MLHRGYPDRWYTNLSTLATIHGRAREVAEAQAHVQVEQTSCAQGDTYQALVLVFNHHRIEAARFLGDAHLWIKEGYPCT